MVLAPVWGSIYNEELEKFPFTSQRRVPSFRSCAQQASSRRSSLTMALPVRPRGYLMDSTSVSLLRHLQRGEDPDSWRLLLEIYQPFLLGLLRARSAQPQDVDDLIQEVLLVVVREIPAFRHSGRPGAFRAWLRSIAANRLRTHWRSQGRDVPTDMLTLAEQFDDPNSELSLLWDRQHDQHVLSRLLALAAPKFETSTFEAFRRVALEGADPVRVAAELNLSVAAVYIAKSRMLRYLRELAEGLVD